MTAKSASYRVVKPMVGVTVSDANGTPIKLDFYEGGNVENPVEGEHLDSLVERGYLEKVSASAAPKADDDKGSKPASSK